jgi:hypothetical protein
MKRSEYEEDVIRKNAELQTHRNFYIFIPPTHLIFLFRRRLVASHVMEASHQLLSCVL